MDSDYAYAKLQSINGDEFFIRNIPLILANTEGKQLFQTKLVKNINLIRCPELQKQLGILYYENDTYKFIPFIDTIVNEQKGESQSIGQDLLNKIDEQRSLVAFKEFDEHSLTLKTMCRIHFPCTKCSMPHFFYFLLPLKEPIQDQTKQPTVSAYTPSKNPFNPFSKVPDRIIYSKWSTDDREALKKILMQFGYGRWGQILSQAGSRFQQKNKPELRAFANAFIRSLIDLIQQQNPELRQFLLNMIEEFPEDPYVEPNVRDWDLQNLKQKLISVAKRIQLMSRIRMFIKKFKDEQFKKLENKDKEQLNWDALLCFLPSSTLYSQRPAIWWTRKYDCDLLRGVYKYGYTNYNAIRQATELGFSEVDKTSLYQEFPVPDTLNKRVKKLVQIILKHETDNGKINFEQQAVSEEEIDTSWPDEDKQVLFKLLCDFGVPIAADGRQSWQDLRDRFQTALHNKFEKSVTQLERMVQNIRITCQQILLKGGKGKEKDDNQEFSNSQSISSDDGGDNDEDNEQIMKLEEIKEDVIKQPDNVLFQLNLEDAHIFSKNTNMLHFIRKQVLPSSGQLFQLHYEDLQKVLELKDKSDPSKIQNDDYKLKDDDILLFQILSQHGFSSLKALQNYDPFKSFKIPITQQQALSRVEWLCTFFKNLRDQQNLKRKSEFNLKNEVQKKVRIPVEKDLDGELVLPMQVNASLRLVNLGKIIPSVYYHSEHNLFPVGFKSVRSYASIFTRGVRCQYTCEILEGQDGRPIFKVISEEDPENPIIRTSCTGCWVHICQKVNDLQEHKKQKVTISGTDRFGLLDPNIARYLEELQNAEKCQKYKFKYRQDMIQQQMFH